jgi:hypothetical protein
MYEGASSSSSSSPFAGGFAFGAAGAPFSEVPSCATAACGVSDGSPPRRAEVHACSTSTATAPTANIKLPPRSQDDRSIASSDRSIRCVSTDQLGFSSHRTSREELRYHAPHEREEAGLCEKAGEKAVEVEIEDAGCGEGEVEGDVEIEIDGDGEIEGEGEIEGGAEAFCARDAPARAPPSTRRGTSIRNTRATFARSRVTTRARTRARSSNARDRRTISPRSSAKSSS